jgi:hypothetical protein
MQAIRTFRRLQRMQAISLGRFGGGLSASAPPVASIIPRTVHRWTCHAETARNAVEVEAVGISVAKEQIGRRSRIRRANLAP